MVTISAPAITAPTAIKMNTSAVIGALADAALTGVELESGAREASAITAANAVSALTELPRRPTFSNFVSGSWPFAQSL